MCLDRAVRVGEAFPRVRGKVVWKAARLREAGYEVRGGLSPFTSRYLKLGETQVPDAPNEKIRMSGDWSEHVDAAYPAGIHCTPRRADAVKYAKWNWSEPAQRRGVSVRILRGVLLGKVLLRGVQGNIPVLIVDKVIWVEDVGPVFKDGE